VKRIGGLALIFMLFGCSDRTPPEPVSQNIRPAKLMTVTSQVDGLQYNFIARLEALQSIDLSFEVGGPLHEMPVREGESIETGSMIASLDPTEFQLAVQEAMVQLKLAVQDLTRKRKVLAENGIAKSAVEDAQSNYELQRVRLNKAKERLSDTRIYAPFVAYVSRRYFDTFVNVTSGTPIVKLHDLTKLQVIMNIPENLIATGSADEIHRSWVEFSFAPGRQFEMSYYENRGDAESLAQTYEVSFVMDNPEDLNLLPGMTASATIEMKKTDDASILLPSSSLVPTPENKLAVWIFDPVTKIVSRRVIESGAPTQSGVPVTAGLQPGEQVVVAGGSQLQEGMQVRPL
jgi:RND family efflux transporter MFP subunit